MIAACCNLGVGGSVNSWKTVFWIGAGLSIGVGILRIFFPESKQFIEARKHKKEHPELYKDAGARAFWSDCKKMLVKEWRMCIYCIVLMTWFNYYSHTSQDSYTVCFQTLRVPARMLICATDFLAYAEGIQERCSQSRFDSYEDWCLCRWHNHRLPLAVDRPSSRNHHLSFHLSLSHSSLDSATDRAQSQCQRILHAVLRPRSLGSHSDPSQRT